MFVALKNNWFNSFLGPWRIYNKTKDWALVQDAALAIDIKVLKLG